MPGLTGDVMFDGVYSVVERIVDGHVMVAKGEYDVIALESACRF